MRYTLILGMLVAATMAGCTEAPEEEIRPPGTEQAEPAEVTQSTGAIEGQVLDDEARPVGGVKVELTKTGNSTTTDRFGRYSFSNLEPDTYEIKFSRFGFLSAGRTASVPAADVAQVNIILVFLSFDVPYQELEIFEGHIMAGSALLDLVTTGTGYGCEVCRFWFNATRGVEVIVLEVTGQKSTDIPTDDNDFFFELVGEEHGGRYLADYWAIGDQRRVQGGFPEEGDAMQLSNYCSIWTVCIDQRYDLFATKFYFQGPLDGYTALPED